MPVSVDILNKDSIGEDYQIGDPVIDQQRVTITGGKETVDSIAFVRGVVNLKGADSTVDKMISLHAYDNSGSQVDTDISPSSVHVRVPITRVSKQLDIQGITTGKPADGYSVSSLELSEKQATVFAEDGDALNEITAIEPLSVSVDGLKEDRTVNVNVPVPPGATKVTPKTVKVTVHIVPSEKPASGQDGDSSSSSSGASSSGSSGSSSDSSGSSSSSGQSEASTETRKFSSVPVTAANLSDNRRATLDHNSAVDVSVTGKASDMDRLDRDDIRAEVDLKGLDTGDHQVQVSVAVPEGMTAVSNPGKLKVTIS
jgi:YbbR domain-containing protein